MTSKVHTWPGPKGDLEAYRMTVDAALGETRDVWGEAVLRCPDGPSFDEVAAYLAPVMYGDATYLTDTGVHYVVMTEPADATTFALHVADGSQVLAEYSNKWGAPDWGVDSPRPARGPEPPLVHTLYIGEGLAEVFGVHQQELLQPRLADGWLPILINDHEDSAGTVWHRESFATRDAAGRLVSYLRLQPNELAADTLPRARVRSSRGEATLHEHDHEFGAARQPLVLVLDNEVSHTPVRVASESEYRMARAGCVDHWRSLFCEGAKVTVPDQRVMNAWHNLVIQNSVLGERYSIGNPYETTFLMEAHGAVLSMLRWGFTSRASDCLRRLVDMTNGAAPEWYESWERGIKLSAAAEHARVTGQLTLVEAHLDTYLDYLADFAVQRASDPHGLLAPERYAWDIPTVIYGWHSQAAAWKGSQDLLAVLKEHDHPAATAERLAEAEDLRQAIERAMSASMTELDDGSIFVPVALHGDEEVHPDLTATKAANYWNLVAPYALATGIVRPGSPLARGLLRFQETHGAWLLGLTRFNGLDDAPIPIGEWREDGTGGYRTPGVDNAFGVQTLFFLADNDEADRLALTMYAKLAHGMTPGTFVDGEATSIGVYQDDYFRSCWYPPNGTSNSLFLEALRLIMVRETRSQRSEPTSLDLSWATPRWWLADGGTIALSAMPTSLGTVSFEIRSKLIADVVEVDLDVPAGVPVRVHVRLPRGWRVDPDSADDRWRPEAEVIDIGAEGFFGSVALQTVRES